MLCRLFIVRGLIVAALILSTATAQEPPPKKKPLLDREDVLRRQVYLKKEFRVFKAELVRLSQRLKNSDDANLSREADRLQKVIKVSLEHGLDNQFDTMISLLSLPGIAKDLEKLSKANKVGEGLRKDLLLLLMILKSDSREEVLARQIAELTELGRKVQKIRKAQELTLVNLVRKTTDPKKVARELKASTEAISGLVGDGGKKGDTPQDVLSALPSVKKKLLNALEAQKQAVSKLDKGKKEEAADNASEALAKLKAVGKELETLLRQLREEEVGHLQANLINRFRKMRDAQIQVRDNTVKLAKELKRLPLDKRNALQRREIFTDIRTASVAEDDLVKWSHQALALLRADRVEGAFPEVLRQVYDDVCTVSNRLRKGDVGTLTQNIQKDVIDTLGEMVAALEKQQKKNNNKNNKPPVPLVQAKQITNLLQKIYQEQKNQVDRIREAKEQLEKDVLKDLFDDLEPDPKKPEKPKP